VGLARENRFSVAYLELGLDAAANGLLGCDAVNALAPLAHELDATAHDDVVRVAAALVDALRLSTLVSYVAWGLATSARARVNTNPPWVFEAVA
jgi:hypothetical protein